MRCRTRGQNVLLFVAQLLLLRLRPPVVPDPDRDRRRSSTTAPRAAWRRGPHSAARFLWLSIVSNFGMLGFFKYFNFFVENVARGSRRAGHHGQPAGAAHPAAGRHLVLHVPGDELHDRRVSRRAARAPQPARRRRLRLVLSSPRRRSDSARVVSAAAGRIGAALLDARRRARAFC